MSACHLLAIDSAQELDHTVDWMGEIVASRLGPSVVTTAVAELSPDVDAELFFNNAGFTLGYAMRKDWSRRRRTV